MVGITNVTLLILATARLPFPAMQLGHGLIPSPTVNKRLWSIFKGTFAGKVFELRLLRESVKLLATWVAFCGGGLVRVVGALESVPE